MSPVLALAKGAVNTPNNDLPHTEQRSVPPCNKIARVSLFSRGAVPDPHVNKNKKQSRKDIKVRKRDVKVRSSSCRHWRQNSSRLPNVHDVLYVIITKFEVRVLVEKEMPTGEFK